MEKSFLQSCKATTTMISFKYFFLSALFGGVIGGVLGAMFTLNIFGEQGQEQAEEDEEEAARHPAEMRLRNLVPRAFPSKNGWGREKGLFPAPPIF